MLDLHFSLCKWKGERGRAPPRAKAAQEPFGTPLPWEAGGTRGLRWLFAAVSTPEVAGSERRALPTCPLRAWQAAACKARQVLRSDCVAPPALEGSWMVGGQPPTYLPFSEGCCSSCSAAWSFGKEFSPLVIRGQWVLC